MSEKKKKKLDLSSECEVNHPRTSPPGQLNAKDASSSSRIESSPRPGQNSLSSDLKVWPFDVQKLPRSQAPVDHTRPWSDTSVGRRCSVQSRSVPNRRFFRSRAPPNRCMRMSASRTCIGLLSGRTAFCLLYKHDERRCWFNGVHRGVYLCFWL